jgi:hypothetical protein
MSMTTLPPKDPRGQIIVPGNDLVDDAYHVQVRDCGGGRIAIADIDRYSRAELHELLDRVPPDPGWWWFAHWDYSQLAQAHGPFADRDSCERHCARYAAQLPAIVGVEGLIESLGQFLQLAEFGGDNGRDTRDQARALLASAERLAATLMCEVNSRQPRPR